MPGGTAWYGVPDYHLPKGVLIDEIDEIKSMGVNIKTGVTVGKEITLSQLRDENDAILITTGSRDTVKLRHTRGRSQRNYGRIRIFRGRFPGRSRQVLTQSQI